MAGQAKLNKWLEIAIIIVVILAPAVITIYSLKLMRGIEFEQYYAIARLIKTGAYSQIYNANHIQRVESVKGFTMADEQSAFIAPPIISWTFYPLSLLNNKQSFYLWTAVLAAAALASFFMLCRYLGLTGTKRAWLAILLGAMGPFVLAMSAAHLVPLLLLGLTGLLINLKKKNFLWASIYQSLFWLQPQFVLPLLCFELGIGQIYTVIITVLLAIIGLLISFLIGGLGIVSNWSQLFDQQLHNGACFADCNLQGQLLRFALHKDLANQIAIAAYFVLLIAAFFIGKRVKTKEWQLSILATAIMPLSIVLNLRSASQDLLLLFPGIVFLILMPINSWLKYIRALMIMISLAILLVPLNILLNCYVVEKSVYNPFFWLVVSFSICCIAVEKYSKQT